MSYGQCLGVSVDAVGAGKFFKYDALDGRRPHGHQGHGRGGTETSARSEARTAGQRLGWRRRWRRPAVSTERTGAGCCRDWQDQAPSRPNELSLRGAEAPSCRGRRRRAVQEQRAGRGFPIPHSRDASTGSGVGCGTFTPKLGCHWRARGGQARDTRARIRFCRVRARPRSRGERRRSAPPPPGRRL
jgi:hypothetical protein